MFEECYVLPAGGSFIENTKIGKPDEFDFAIILQYFKNFDKFYSLYKREHIVLLNDPDFISLANDITTNYSAQKVIENFQTILKHLWVGTYPRVGIYPKITYTMEKNIWNCRNISYVSAG